MDKLKPIPYDDELSHFDLPEYTDYREDMNTYLSLEDCGRMVYKLKTFFHTKDYGDLDIVFEYNGGITGEMRVVQNTGVKKYLHRIKYDTDIFAKNIIVFIKKHIKSWKSKYAFNGLDVAIAFYNDVLENYTSYDVEECPLGYDISSDYVIQKEGFVKNCDFGINSSIDFI